MDEELIPSTNTDLNLSLNVGSSCSTAGPYWKKHKVLLSSAALTLGVVCSALLATFSTSPSLRREEEPIRSVKEIISLNKPLEPGCETTLMLMPHCEELDGHCSYLGKERSYFLSSLFGEGARWPKPSRIIAHTDLNVESVSPVADKFGLNVEVFDTAEELADDWLSTLSDGSICGRFTLVSWKHTNLIEVASALNCGEDEFCPTKYKSSEYDEVIQIKYVYDLAQAYQITQFYKKIDEPTTERRLSEQSNWTVYGYVTYQHFDPLAFSHSVGDYPQGGTRVGGRWNEIKF